MQKYTIIVEITKSPSRPGEADTYRVAIHPFTREGGGAMGTKQYLTDKVAFIADLQQKLGYTDTAIERLFADPNGDQTLLDYPLSDEDAAYFGWV